MRALTAWITAISGKLNNMVQVVAELRADLAIRSDTAWIIVSGARHQTRPRLLKNPTGFDGGTFTVTSLIRVDHS
jgi:hypothetical protein